MANDVSPDSLGLLWDDEDTRAFYENLPDLVAIIPSILYKDSKGEAAETETSNKEAESLDNENEDEMAVDEEPVEEVNLEDDEELQEAVRRTELVLCSAPSVPQPVVQSRRRPLLGPSPG